MLTAIKRILRMCGHALTVTVHERLETIEQRSAETDNALLQASIRMAERIPLSAAHVVVEGEGVAPAWQRLIVYLYSHMKSRRAVLNGDASADLTRVLKAAGFEVSLTGTGSTGLWVGLQTNARPELQEPAPEVVVLPVGSQFAEVVDQMRKYEYHWYLVMRSTSDGPVGSFYANYPLVLGGAESHAFFFRDRQVFSEAQSWSAALLKRVYFRSPRV